MTGEDWNAVMYYGIKSWGGIRNPLAIIAIVYFISLVVIGNCILFICVLSLYRNFVCDWAIPFFIHTSPGGIDRKICKGFLLKIKKDFQGAIRKNKKLNK